MKIKLNCVLLIDDDESTNFVNQLVIEDGGYAEKIVTVESGQEALDYIASAGARSDLQPDLIFLDINMPAMNGWEFLDRYKLLPDAQRRAHVVIMLTASLNPDDRKRADEICNVDDFICKPLTSESLQNIIRAHFPDRL
ncbi:MAG: response regulator [Cyclobacteriaceae bacterium]|nr:response regulator [Cyclobacteriaceae bacterium SS2]